MRERGPVKQRVKEAVGCQPRNSWTDSASQSSVHENRKNQDRSGRLSYANVGFMMLTFLI